MTSRPSCHRTCGFASGSSGQSRRMKQHACSAARARDWSATGRLHRSSPIRYGRTVCPVQPFLSRDAIRDVPRLATHGTLASADSCAPATTLSDPRARQCLPESGLPREWHFAASLVRCGLLLPGVKICGLCLRLLRSDPSPVVRHKRRQFRLRVRVTGKRTEHFHAEFDVGNLGRRNLFHFGGRNPRRLHRVAQAAGGAFIRRSRKHRGPRRIQTRRDTECRQLARPIRPPVHP